MDFHKEIRHSYQGGFSILILEGIVWILAGILWNYVSTTSAIILIAVAGMLFYPFGELLQRLLKRPNISKNNPLQGLFTQMSLIIPFSFPIIFMIIMRDISLFFPALTIVVGAHYLPFVYAYKLFTYWIIAALLVIVWGLFGFLFIDHVVFCAYITGISLIIFAFLNRGLVQKEFR